MKIFCKSSSLLLWFPKCDRAHSFYAMIPGSKGQKASCKRLFALSQSGIKGGKISFDPNIILSKIKGMAVTRRSTYIRDSVERERMVKVLVSCIWKQPLSFGLKAEFILCASRLQRIFPTLYGKRYKRYVFYRFIKLQSEYRQSADFI